MAKNTSKKKRHNQTRSSKSKAASQPEMSGPWIPMRSGVLIIAVTSIVMAVLTAWQAIPVKGTVQGILYGLLFGGLIWVIFLVFYLYGRYIRR